jgi:hypothetical protein
MGAALRVAFAAEIPMSHVMPETGVVSTDGVAWPDVYHQMAMTMLAQRGNPIVIRDIRVFVGTATDCCISLAIAPPVNLRKSNSATAVLLRS